MLEEKVMENQEEIILVKLYGGDLIIGKKSNEQTSSFIQNEITLLDPRAIVIAPTMTGDVRVAIASVSEPFKVKRLKEKLVVPKVQIMFELAEDEIDKELINGYKSEISGIRIASVSETASINSGTSASDFTL